MGVGDVESLKEKRGKKGGGEGCVFVCVCGRGSWTFFVVRIVISSGASRFYIFFGLFLSDRMLEEQGSFGRQHLPRSGLRSGPLPSFKRMRNFMSKRRQSDERKTKVPMKVTDADDLEWRNRFETESMTMETLVESCKVCEFRGAQDVRPVVQFVSGGSGRLEKEGGKNGRRADVAFSCS